MYVTSLNTEIVKLDAFYLLALITQNMIHAQLGLVCVLDLDSKPKSNGGYIYIRSGVSLPRMLHWLLKYETWTKVKSYSVSVCLTCMVYILVDMQSSDLCSISFQMISAEAPVLFAKAAEIFISELSLRAWVHTEDNKRRTLQVLSVYVFSCYIEKVDIV